jgi:large conductance mechanosensitive channel
MGLFQDFKAFISRGNVVDLAVGVIVGGAFGKIVSSLVADMIMPPVGLLLGRMNVADLKFQIGGAVTGKNPVTINYGNFLQATLDFLIVAGAVFLLIQAVNRLQRKAGAASPEKKPEPSAEEKLLTEIRDLLKAQGPAH